MYQRYELKKDDSGDDYILYIYLDDYLTEFAEELVKLPRKRKDFVQNVKKMVNEKYPKFKVNVVKVLIGGIAITTIPLAAGNEEPVEAAENIAFTQREALERGEVTYYVVSGDTLFGIAKKFSTTVSLIKEANHLYHDHLKMNQSLIIPKAIHKVATNDTLYSLARNYGTSANVIKEANGLKSEILKTGQELVIPNRVDYFPIDFIPANITTYTVNTRDNLWAIANRFGTTVDMIKRANQLKSDHVQRGQTLIIPVNTKMDNGQLQQADPIMGIQRDQSRVKVENVQKDLQQLGYYDVPTMTGSYDITTTKVIENFQKDYGLSVTGKLNEATRTAIKHALVKKALIADTKNYEGIPYEWGGTTPTGFDCSGFVYFMFNKHGVNIPRNTSFGLYKQGISIDRQELMPGDLVFFSIDAGGRISHVGFYIGDNQFISATSPHGIKAVSMDHSYWRKYYVGAKRIY
jgi:peptidoglycan DL-endopeptidase LytF